jgi:hypothetical protein
MTPASSETSPLDAATYSQNIELVSHFGGTANEVAARGNYAYAAFGPELAVIDISNPANPVRINYLVLSSDITDIHLSGEYAYVVLDYVGLAVIDLSQPDAPVQVSTYSFPYAGDVVVTGHHAFIVERFGPGLWIVDLSNPAAPSGFKLSDVQVSEVAAVGNRLYLLSFTDYNDRLVVWDISNPTAPTELGTYDPPHGLYDLAVRDNYAYLVTPNGFEIINVSDASHPVLEGFLPIATGFQMEVLLAGEYAYLRRSDEGIRVVNIADPRAPTEVGNYELPQATSMAVTGHYMVVSERWYGLRVFDISNPEVLTPAGEGWPLLILGSMVWVEDYLYAASGGEWKIMDVSDPFTPTVVGTFSANARDWVVAGDYAYGLHDLYQLNILDISDPTAPTQIGSFIQPDATFADIALYGDYAYLADVGECHRGGCYNGGIWVIDISNPAAPSQVGFVETSTSSVTVVKDYLYRHLVSGHLEALELSDPAHPTSAGRLPSLSWFVVEGDFLYSIEPGRLDIFDVSNPLVPVRRGSYPTFTYHPFTDLLVADNRLYIAGSSSPESDRTSVITMVDVSNPDAPVGLGRYLLPGSTHYEWGFEVSRDYIYSTTPQGLFILRYTGGTLTTYNSYLPLASRNR